MTKLNTRFPVLPLIAALTLAGCNSIPFIDTSPDYKTANRGKPLEVPPDLTSLSTSDVYQVPVSGTTYSEYSEGRAQQQQQEQVHERRADDGFHGSSCRDQGYVSCQTSSGAPPSILTTVRCRHNRCGWI